jgi:hypothetical protein
MSLRLPALLYLGEVLLNSLRNPYPAGFCIGIRDFETERFGSENLYAALLPRDSVSGIFSY